MDLFNNKKRKMAEEAFLKNKSEYEQVSDEINRNIITLYHTRKSAVNAIENSEADLKKRKYVKLEYIIDVADIKSEIRNFKESVEKEEYAMANSSNAATGAVLTGTAVGAAIATLGPTTAMALATTFGTAATGTAISALSGAAATNAALAFLGGGAIAAGGAGVAGGAALLAAIPIIGWSIGGVAAVGGGLLIAKKNMKIAESLYEQNSSIIRATSSLQDANEKVLQCEKDITFCICSLNGLLDKLKDDENLDTDLKTIIGVLRLICDKINTKISL